MAKKPKYPTYAPVPTKGGAKAPTPPTDFDQAIDRRRVKDVDSARTIFTRLQTDNQLRSTTYMQVMNQLQGGRPRDQDQLEANGSGWETNVNFGDAQASRNRTLIPYWKMVNDVPRKSAVTIPSNAPKAEVWQTAFEECYDEFLEDWNEDYKQQFMRMCANFVNFGPGIMQFCDEGDPRYNAINAARMYFPKNCQMSLDQWEVVALVRDVSANELYKYVRDAKTTQESTYAGWNADAIKETIVQSSEMGGPRPDWRDFARSSDMLVNNDIAVTTPFAPVPTVWLYVKGFDGKIACRVFTQAGGVNDFLYEDDDCAENFRELFNVCWYDTGTDGMVHSIKGFGIKNYFPSALMNRAKSRMVDSMTVALALNFQYQNDNQPDETPPVESYGACTIFPPGLTQLPIYPNLQAAMPVLEMLENNASENNSLYRQQNDQIAASDTATQANILANMQGQLSEASASLFLAQYSQTITEQFRRLRLRGNKNADAKKFVERLKDRGIPDEVIYDHELRVRTGANSGLANPALRVQAFQEGLQLMHYPGVNGRFFLEGLIAERYGAHAVNKALLPLGADSEPLQRRQAQMENVDFGQGVMLQAAPEDAHYEHLQEHLKPAAGIAGQFKQSQKITPEQTAALTIGVEHAGQHMSFLSQDETEKAHFQEIMPQFRLIQSIARGVLTQAKNGQQQNGGGAPNGAAPAGGGGPNGSAKESISINYKDAPPDIRRQMEAAAGFQPSNGQAPMVNGAQ
jgi:hypothetical protein